jgi:hypothetical protein
MTTGDRDEAIDIGKGRSELAAAAVAPSPSSSHPARVDLIDEVVVPVGGRGVDRTPDSPLDAHAGRTAS